MVGGVSQSTSNALRRNASVPAWVLLGLFALLAAFAGGASRYDAIQIVLLRSLSAFLLIGALYQLRSKAIKGERVLLSLFGSLVLLIVIQLVPLPPEAWQSLAGRDAVSQLDAIFGLERSWRPITFAPMRTWNALGSLVVPVTALLLAIALRVPTSALLQSVAALGVLNALMGLLQMAGGASSIFYLYAVTNLGAPVGVFANENHAAVFAACSLLVIANLWVRAREVRGAAWKRMVYSIAFLLILFTALVGGSRAGFAAAVGAVTVSIAMYVLAPPPRHVGRRSQKALVQNWFDRHPRLVFATPLFLVSLIFLIFFFLGRVPALQDLLSGDSFQDLRWLLLPVIREMLDDHWLIGAGFGSFEQVYHIYEPSELLMPFYVNQAHNDGAQFVVEGGLLAGLILTGILMWVARCILRTGVGRLATSSALFWSSVFAIVGVASIIDYPLRAPLFQVVMIWLLVALSQDSRGAKLP